MICRPPGELLELGAGAAPILNMPAPGAPAPGVEGIEGIDGIEGKPAPKLKPGPPADGGGVPLPNPPKTGPGLEAAGAPKEKPVEGGATF